jgi:hypothetical protein
MKLFCVSIACLGLAACGSSTDNADQAATTAKITVASAPAGSLTVELLTDTRLETGLTPVHIKVTGAGGVSVTDATVGFLPMMAMANGKNHTCPTMGLPTLGADLMYHVGAVFQMASTEVDTWSASVSVIQPDGTTAVASFPLLVVADSGRSKVFTYTDPVTATATKYVSSMNFAGAPQVGLNPIVFTLHRMQDMTTFPSVDDAVITLDPQMPSMGHGSPGSIDPTLTAPGRYEGKLSFSMTGEWKTTTTIQVGGVVLGAPVFTTTF